MGTLKDHARELALSRKPGQRKGGRPRVLRPCPHCGGEYATAKLRKHAPNCRRPAMQEIDECQKR